MFSLFLNSSSKEKVLSLYDRRKGLSFLKIDYETSKEQINSQTSNLKFVLEHGVFDLII